MGTIQYQIEGFIDPQQWNAGAPARITITAVPTNEVEWEELQKQIGHTPHGAVLLQLLAFEMYRGDAGAADHCIELNNTPTNASETKRRMRDLIMRKGDSYARPYIAAAYFNGANPQNGYTPVRPFSVNMRVSMTRPYQMSQTLRGMVLTLDVWSEGYDTPWRTIEVVQPYDSPYYKVSNCTSIYTQCKEIGWGKTYQGL